MFPPRFFVFFFPFVFVFLLPVVLLLLLLLLCGDVEVRFPLLPRALLESLSAPHCGGREGGVCHTV